MNGNYHAIKTIINNSHNFSEMVYGITSYTHGLFKANIIKIKNTASAKLSLKSKTHNNIIQITTKDVNTSLKIHPNLNINNIIIKNTILNKILKIIYTHETFLIITNTLWMYISKVAEIKNKLSIINDTKHGVVIQKKENLNSIVIDDDVDITLKSKVRIITNNIEIKNPPINSSAWYFLKLGNLSGTLGEVSSGTLDNFGRKKVI